MGDWRRFLCLLYHSRAWSWVFPEKKTIYMLRMTVLLRWHQIDLGGLCHISDSDFDNLRSNMHTHSHGQHITPDRHVYIEGYLFWLEKKIRRRVLADSIVWQRAAVLLVNENSIYSVVKEYYIRQLGLSIVAIPSLSHRTGGRGSVIGKLFKTSKNSFLVGQNDGGIYNGCDFPLRTCIGRTAYYHQPPLYKLKRWRPKLKKDKRLQKHRRSVSLAPLNSSLIMIHPSEIDKIRKKNALSRCHADMPKPLYDIGKHNE